jgi:hypothetical protein
MSYFAKRVCIVYSPKKLETSIVAMRPLAAVSSTLSAAVSGTQLQLNWPQDHTGWLLQAQTNSLNIGVGTNWVNVSGSDAMNQRTIPINPMNGSVFFRLACP